MKFSDETEADLRILVERDFGSVSNSDDFGSVVLNWLHFKARSIPIRPRIVLLSSEVHARRSAYPAVDRIKYEFEMGRDVTPWLSDSVRKRKMNPHADLMFNDWQISHFHLGNVFEQKNKITRRPPPGGELLFAHVKADRVTFLNILPHSSWGNQELLKILHHTSPVDSPIVKGIIAPRRGERTDSEIIQMRQSGCNTFIEVENKVMFSPGLGVASSKHAVRLVRYFDKLTLQIRYVGDCLSNNNLPHFLLAKLAGSIGLPIRLGLKMVNGGFVLYEKTRALNLLGLPPLE